MFGRHWSRIILGVLWCAIGAVVSPPMSDQRIITVFKTCCGIEGFEKWLFGSGASPVTVENYSRAVTAWLGVLEANEGHPGAIWGRWNVGIATKRMTGFACRRYAEYVEETSGETLDLGIPKRLPAASRPNPQPVSDDDLGKLLRTAKAILPQETGFSVRVWLRFIESLGLRRSESEISWNDVKWSEKSVLVNGKTGERELPLSRKLIKLLEWLHRRNWKYPWRGARGQELKGQVLYNIFKQVCVAAGTPNLHPHLLRHRRLTALCRSQLGSNQLLVLSFSGHSHVSALAHYYAVSLDEKRALLNVP